VSLDLAGLISTIEHNIAQHDALDERAREMNQREESGDHVRSSEWEYLTDDQVWQAGSHYDVLTQALELLKQQESDADRVHLVYLADGDSDSALIFRDEADADRRAADENLTHGKGFAWVDSKIIR
jgi:hypothetical protein